MPTRCDVHFVDAHNHLYDPRLASATQQMQSCIAVVNGTHVEDWRSVYEFAQSSTKIVPSFGLHPWFIKAAPVTWRDTLLRYLTTIPSGVGEVGLDRVRDDVPFERQEEVFREQVEIALLYKRPLSIHSVRSDERVLKVLSSSGQRDLGFLMHSFAGSEAIAKKLLDRGAYLSLSGTTLHHEGQKARELLRYIPRDRLLLETDASNQPLDQLAAIEGIYVRIAQILQVELQELKEMLVQNFRSLFGSIASIN